MLDSDRKAFAVRALERHADFVAGLDQLIERIKDMRGGYSSGGVGGARGGADSTQPERLAGERDPVQADLHRVDRLVLEVDSRVAELAAIQGTYAEGRRGTAGMAEEGCRSCARVRGHWSPVYRSSRCRWCYDRSLELQADPPVKAVEWKLDGRRVTERMIRDAQAEEALVAAEKVARHRKVRKKRRARR